MKRKRKTGKLTRVQLIMYKKSTNEETLKIEVRLNVPRSRTLQEILDGVPEEVYADEDYILLNEMYEYARKRNEKYHLKTLK